MSGWLSRRFIAWLNYELPGAGDAVPMTDMERLCEEVRQADVILVEGRSRLSEVIKSISSSPWTHAALYIGRVDEIHEGALQNLVAEHYSGDPREQLVVEALLGHGTIVRPLKAYAGLHVRICRPRGLSRQDRQLVIAHAINQLGYEYDLRHMLDLARFMLPYSFIPKRWRSVLFTRGSANLTRNVCSYMIAEAFNAVRYPILPVAERLDGGGVKLYPRNTRLFAPRDFDYSPYFDIIKYPYVSFDEVAAYRALPWDENGIVCDKTGQFRKPESGP